MLSGQQGSAKTTTGRLLRSLVDPHQVPLRRPPREERELAIAAGNAWIVALDNLSRIPEWLSDGLCCLATGGGFGARALYSDGEEALFSYKRPCILTSIEDTIERGDLLDRALLVELAPIAPSARRTERELWAAFAREHPALLGALLDVVADALGRVETINLREKPRLADFAQWATAAEPALGWAQGDFLASYVAGRADARVRALDASPLVAPLRQLLVEHGAVWEGAATDLLAALERYTDEATRRRKEWPKGGNILSGALRRLAPNLEAAGIVYEALARTRGVRPHRLSLAIAPEEDRCKASSPSSSSPSETPIPERQPPETDDDSSSKDRHQWGDPRHRGHGDRHPSSRAFMFTPEGGAPSVGADDAGDAGDGLLRPFSLLDAAGQ